MSIGALLLKALFGFGGLVKRAVEWLFEDPARVLVLLMIIESFALSHVVRQRNEARALAAAEHAAHEQTKDNFVKAAKAAERFQAERNLRVAKQQADISQERIDSLETRLADARDRVERLRRQSSAAHSGRPGAAGLPAPGQSPASAPETPGEDGFPAEGSDAGEMSLAERLVATEQAIQLDELITWVEQQQLVQVNGAPPAGEP